MGNQTLQFNVSSLLKQGTGTRELYSFVAPLKFDDVKIASDIKGKVEIMKIDDGINAKMEDVRLMMDFRCDRCLKSFKQEVLINRAERQYLFEAPRKLVDPNDLFLIDMKNETIDLKEPLRQEIILHFPLIPVCSKSCLGICPHCGKNRNRGQCNCRTEKTLNKPLSALKQLLK